MRARDLERELLNGFERDDSNLLRNGLSFAFGRGDVMAWFSFKHQGIKDGDAVSKLRAHNGESASPHSKKPNQIMTTGIDRSIISGNSMGQGFVSRLLPEMFLTSDLREMLNGDCEWRLKKRY
jgi:hypothetical protein